MKNSLKNKQIIIGFSLLITFFSLLFPLNTIKGTKDEQIRYGGTLIDSSFTDADFFNPVLSTNSVSTYIESFIFEGMLTYDKDMQVVPELALSWDISPSKLDYTFYLREDVYWQTNVPFTADDVIFTWDRILDPRTNTTRALMFDLLDFDNVPYEKLGDHTVVFHLKTTFAPILNNMMFPIIPEHIFEQYSPAEGEGEYQFNDCPPNFAPIGTGPMIFDSWIRDDQLIFIRNSQANGGPGYWREHDAYLDRFIIKVISHATTQLLALNNGEIDMMDISSIEFSEVEDLKDDPNFVVYTAPKFASDHIAFNCDPRKGHHTDIRNFTTEPNYFAGFEWMEDDPTKLPGSNIRKALNYAIDKDHLIEVVYPYGYRNLGPMYLAQTDWYYEGVECYDYDLTKANQRLTDAGFGVDANDPLRKNLNFTLSYEQGNLRLQAICNYAKGSWESTLGIVVAVEPVEKNTMLLDYFDHRMFDVVAASWTGNGGDPDLTNVWHSKSIEPGGNPSGYNPSTYVWTWDGDPVPGGLNYMGYWNYEVDNLLNIAREEPEKIVRKMYYDQIQSKIVDDSPYIWLLAHIVLKAVRSNIHGMIQGSTAGLWPQPIGFHNIWKEGGGTMPTDTSMWSTTGITITTSSSSSTYEGVNGNSSELEFYLLSTFVLLGSFAVGGVLGVFFQRKWT